MENKAREDYRLFVVCAVEYQKVRIKPRSWERSLMPRPLVSLVSQDEAGGVCPLSEEQGSL